MDGDCDGTLHASAVKPWTVNDGTFDPEFDSDPEFYGVVVAGCSAAGVIPSEDDPTGGSRD